MSAFQMDDHFFNQLANEFSCRGASESDILNHSIREFLGIDFHQRSDFDAIDDAAQTKCQALLNANYDAVNDRYNEDDVAGFVSAPKGFVKWSPAQLIKHLACLRYQCSEGDVIESDIYKQLSTLIGDLSYDLVNSLPEYDEAAWDYQSPTHEVTYV